MTRRGPQYLICGSRLSCDTLVLRAMLEGLNTQGRHWGEVIVIQDDGSLRDLEHEVDGFKYLEHRRVDGWEDPNVVLCFMDRMSHNRASEQLLETAKAHHRPWFVIGGAEERIANGP